MSSVALSWGRSLAADVVRFRRPLAAILGLATGQILVRTLYVTLSSSPAFEELYSLNHFIADYALNVLRWPLWLGAPLVAVGVLNFVETRTGKLGSSNAAPSRLPSPPISGETAVVLGEAHAQFGEQCDRPEWVIQPANGLYTGTLIVGGTGRGKTAGAILPYSEQLIRLHRANPLNRLSVVVFDPKGNLRHEIREMCERAERSGDYYEIAMPTSRLNLIERRDLGPEMVADLIVEAMRNLDSREEPNPFWERAAASLCAKAIRLVRLTRRREPTLSDVYRITASKDSFEAAMKELSGGLPSLKDESAEIEALEFWFRNTLEQSDERTRANVSMTLATLVEKFDGPALRRCFCALGQEQTFPGFAPLLDQGKVIVVSLPKGELKDVGQFAMTLLKLNLEDAILARVSRAAGSNQVAGREVALVCDEFGVVASRSDPDFLSRAREGRCIPIVALQSFATLETKMHRPAVDLLVSNLTTRVFLGLTDPQSAERAAAICGKTERWKTSKTKAESGSRSHYSFLDRRRLVEGQGSSSVSETLSLREEYLFKPEVFARCLVPFQAIVCQFDGHKEVAPRVVYLKPAFLDAGISFFDQQELR